MTDEQVQKIINRMYLCTFVISIVLMMISLREAMP
jgi:hypothetical protein